jgi:hypothetical protein
LRISWILFSLGEPACLLVAFAFVAFAAFTAFFAPEAFAFAAFGAFLAGAFLPEAGFACFVLLVALFLGVAFFALICHPKI